MDDEDELPPPLDYARPKPKKFSTVTQPTILGRNHLSDEASAPPEDREYALLPERGAQTAPDLRPADEQWTVAAHQAASRAAHGGQELPMMQFFAKHVAEGNLAQDPETLKPILSMFSRVLNRDAEVAFTMANARARAASIARVATPAGSTTPQRTTRPVVRQQSRPTHVGSADGAASNYRRIFVPLSDAETERDMHEWYKNDKFDTPIDYKPLQSDVSQIPAYTSLAAQLVEARKRQRHADEFLLGDLPRPLSANGGRPIPRAYILLFRYPPRPELDRACLNGDLCVFNLSSYAPHGYVGREFLLPGQDPTPPDKPSRVCIDCLLIEYRSQQARTPNNGTTPAEPINSFTVDPREYGRHCFMETLGGDELATGIIGLVPIYARNRRDIFPIPPAAAKAYGLTDPDRIYYYVAEINEDFREASATSTPALPTNLSSHAHFSEGSSAL